jgi:hypothetical protein
LRRDGRPGLSGLLKQRRCLMRASALECWCSAMLAVPCGQLLLGPQSARASACQHHVAHPEFESGVIWGMTWVLLRLEENDLEVDSEVDLGVDLGAESYWLPRCGSGPRPGGPTLPTNSRPAWAMRSACAALKSLTCSG